MIVVPALNFLTERPSVGFYPSVETILVAIACVRAATQEINLADTKSKPAPLETEPGKQMDDNIDELGRKQDGSKQEQPGSPTERRPDGHAHKTVETEAGGSVPKTRDDLPPNPSILPSNPD